MNPADLGVVQAYLKDLRLPAIARMLPDTLRDAEQHGRSPLDVLRVLLEAELEQRQKNQSQRRIQAAKFPYAKGLETFDFTANPDLKKSQIFTLAQGDYIRQRRSVIFLGNSGRGKTHLAIALGREACYRGFKVRFYTAAGLVNELVTAQNDQQLMKFETRWLKWDLVIIDELGYIPLRKLEAELLFQFFSLRYERGSFIVTTNLNFDRWSDVFGDAQLTAALLDRLTHKAVIITTNGESYRFRESMKAQTTD
ncbi:MAG: ATP-binding protein [Firmicutes bacterium]|jgi:DNA replication protein DnaC|nr:ATP-binding protein [Bacillota bacterium]